MRYLVTGGTGFIGRRAVSRLLDTRPDAEVLVLVRRASLGRFEQLADASGWGERVRPLVGDLTEPGLGLDASDDLGADAGVDHVLHCAAIYDVTAPAADQQAANVDGTRAVIQLARRLDATLHHVSSIAVAGDYPGEFAETDFDVGQVERGLLPSAYHRTKFEAEKLVRAAGAEGLRHRIYRPAVVVGDSRTGEMDKVDGPYYFFPLLARLAALPGLTPMMLPDVGRTNVVPVDYVVESLVTLMHADGGAGADDAGDGTTFHLTARRSIALPDIYRGVAAAAGLPRLRAALPGGAASAALQVAERFRVWRNAVATQIGIPGEVLDLVELRPTFVGESTRAALLRAGAAVVEPPPFADYAEVVWRYWAEHLDPDRARFAGRARRGVPRGRLAGRNVLITGASSGIGRASAIAAARHGAQVFALARNGEALDELVAEIRAEGGRAHAFTCDITDSASVDHTIKDILGRFDHVDYLVNNAGRSIRRSVAESTDRLHDYERTMAVNYFGAVRMVLALLPHWRERRFGHVVNVSSIAVLGGGPKYSAYVPTKAALDAFTDAVAAETLSDHVTFTTIHMPLVATPMIDSSRRFNPNRPISAEHAAAMVLRGLIEKPARIDTPMGSIGATGNYLAPKLSRRVLHQLHLLYPDTPAARGVVREDTREPEPRRASRARVSSRRRSPARAAARPIRRAAKLIPGVHW